LVIQEELIQCYRYPGLPQQLAETAHGAGVLFAFVPVADEDLFAHRAIAILIPRSNDRDQAES
jgi:hypothetical protein